jgi:hypothetical protein
MANWCYNSIRITDGKEEDIIKFSKSIIRRDEEGNLCSGGSAELNFAQALGKDPETYDCPVYAFHNYLEDDEKYGAFYPDDDEYILTCDTKWSPLDRGLMSEIAQKYQIEISLDYEESGCEFCGRIDFLPTGEVNIVYEAEGDNYCHSLEGLELAFDIPLEEIPGRMSEFDPDLDDPGEFSSQQAFNVLKRRLAGENPSRDEFPQLEHY